MKSQPSSDSSLTKVPSLQTTGSPQGTGFPSTSGQNSGTFGAALRQGLKKKLLVAFSTKGKNKNVVQNLCWANFFNFFFETLPNVNFSII